VTTLEETLGSDEYDEFALLHENAEEWGLPFDRPPPVARLHFELPSRQTVSYLRWGEEPPEIVFLHGGAQNAHTWDTVVLALGKPAIAFDLPGHGHSDRRPDRDYGPWRNAEAIEAALAELGGPTKVIVGMSLGGVTVIRLAAIRPDLCHRAVIIDATPQVNDSMRKMTTAERGSVALIDGPPIYDSFEEMAQAAIALSPLRAASGVRRGVRHNATRLDDGRWTWRYDLFGGHREDAASQFDFTSLWDDVSSIQIPTLLVRGGESHFVRDDDVAEMQRRLPSMEVVVVDGAGHAVQSDRPLELARLIREFADPSAA